jgi:hypothetical protein
MAILIKDAHDFIRMQIKKNKMGFVSPEDIDRAINRGVSDWMSAVVYKYKKTGKYSYDHLFVKRKDYAVTSSNAGLMDMPTDYTEALTVYVMNNGVLTEGTIYSWDEFLEIQNSNILAPVLAYPAATIYVAEAGTAKIQFKPTPSSSGTTYTFTLVYMRKPAAGVYKYTVSSTTGTIAYNPTGSVDLDIDDRYFSDILTRALMYLGISLHDSDTASTEQLKDVNQKNDER